MKESNLINRQQVFDYICDYIYNNATKKYWKGGYNISLLDKINMFFESPIDECHLFSSVEIMFNVLLPTYNIEKIIDLLDFVWEGLYE
jgi:hypothetical protein